MNFAHIQPGDTVTRMLAGSVPMELTVAAVDDRFIYCGPQVFCSNCGDPQEDHAQPCTLGWKVEDYPGWKFDRTFGYEVDEYLGWGMPGEDGKILTGSYLVMEGDDERDRNERDRD